MAVRMVRLLPPRFECQRCPRVSSPSLSVRLSLSVCLLSCFVDTLGVPA